MITSITDDLKQYSTNLLFALNSVDNKQLESAYACLHKALCFKDHIFVCGNGGSAAISDHFMCDHTKGICHDTSFSSRVVSLSSNMSLITAIANDYAYDQIFSKQIEMYSPCNHDVLVTISSSGNSPNVINAVEIAKIKGMNTIALVGFDGGKLSQMADIVLHIKSNNYGIVEDCHQSLMHLLAQNIRKNNAKLNAELKL